MSRAARLLFRPCSLNQCPVACYSSHHSRSHKRRRGRGSSSAPRSRCHSSLWFPACCPSLRPQCAWGCGGAGQRSCPDLCPRGPVLSHGAAGQAARTCSGVRGSPCPLLGPRGVRTWVGLLGGMRQDVKVDGHSIGKRCASSSSTSASVPAPVPLGRCHRLPLPSAPLPTTRCPTPLSVAVASFLRLRFPLSLSVAARRLTLSAAVCPVLGTTSRPMFCCRSASRTKIKLLYLKLKNVILDFGVACRRAAARIALLLLRGVMRVFRGFGQCQAAPTHPHVFCGLDQKFLTDTPQFYIFSSVVHAEFCWNCRFPPHPCMYGCMVEVSQIHNSPTPTHHPAKLVNSKNPKYPTREKKRNPGYYPEQLDRLQRLQDAHQALDHDLSPTGPHA